MSSIQLLRSWTTNELRTLSRDVVTIMQAEFELNIVAGSYEGSLVGYALSQDVIDGLEAHSYVHTPVFAMSAHDGCVRAAATGGNLLATSSTDNSIAVYNLRKRRAFGKLVQQVRPPVIGVRSLTIPLYEHTHMAEWRHLYQLSVFLWRLALAVGW